MSAPLTDAQKLIAACQEAALHFIEHEERWKRSKSELDQASRDEMHARQCVMEKRQKLADAQKALDEYVKKAIPL